jgi:Fe-S-cluster containining protein
MVNPNQLRFSCIRCGNCCTDKNTLVNLTYLDILRIVKGLKLELREILEIVGFYVFDEEETNIFFKKLVFTPIRTEKGFAFVGILKNTEGKCVFYDMGKQQCSVYQIRPRLCQTFPFSYDLDKKTSIFYTEKAISYCPGIEGDSPIINGEHWLTIGKQTLDEIRKNNIFNEKWNKNINSIHIVENYLKEVMKFNV